MVAGAATRRAPSRRPSRRLRRKVVRGVGPDGGAAGGPGDPLRRGARRGRGHRARRRRRAPLGPPGQRHARPGPAPAGGRPVDEAGAPRARLRWAWGSCCWRFPAAAHAWTPGHAHLSRRVGAGQPAASLPAAVADLLRAYPFDFLYGNIAADSSIAKHYAPLGPTLPLLARGPGDPRPGRLRRAARLRAGLPLPSRGRYRRPQLFRARASSCSPAAPPRSAIPTGRPGSRPTWATPTRRSAKDVILLRPRRGGRAPRPDHRADHLQRANQPAAVPRHGPPHRELELAAGHPGGAGVQPLAARRSRRRAPPGALLRLHDGVPRRAAIARAPARSLGRAAAQDRQGASPAGAARQRVGATSAKLETRGPGALRPARPAARSLDPHPQPPALARAGERGAVAAARS